MQKFKHGLNLELQLDVRRCKVTTLGALVDKAKSIEEVKNKMKWYANLRNHAWEPFDYYEPPAQ